MKKTRFILAIALFISISFAIVPPAVPQIGTYQFHGAAGNQKILKVNTVNNASLEILWGENWTEVIEIFGAGAADLGARKKSVVTAVDFEAKFLGVYDAANYTTDNWKWNTGTFPETPDDLSGINVTSFYNPKNLSSYVNLFYSGLSNVSVQNAGAFFAQLPTPVDNYLAEIIWIPRWEAVDNTAVHHGQVGDLVYSIFTAKFYVYLSNCTETWSYDTTYGAWIGYKVAINDTTIYEFNVELPSILPGIPGFDMTILLGTTGFIAIGLIYLVMKKKNK